VNLTRIALSNSVAVFVAVLLALLFGLLSLERLPIQLTPEVESPEITITTQWRAAAPQEIEANIIEPQEKVLRGLPGMTRMLSKVRRGQGEVTVTFTMETDLKRGLIEVMNRLNRVPRYPVDAEEPILSTVGGDSRPIAWFIIRTLPGNERDIASYQDFVEEVVQTRFERVPGVALSEVRGGREREVRITFDPYKAASLGVQLPVVARLTGGNEDVSGGVVDVGKRRYTIRFAGALSSQALQEMVIDWRDGRPVHLRDVAQVEVRLEDRNSFVITNGAHAIAVNAHRETGVNELEVMTSLQSAMQELAQGPLARANLSIKQVYDETIYIHRSIRMLSNNLALGIVLAIAVLWWFLRKFRATLMVAISIPVSLIVAFLVLDLSAHTLNVISLAGMAFAVGMVLDAGIVVLENIVRLREQGRSVDEAVLQAPAQVWGALLASTATTVAIFLPIVFLRDEAGQLFADLAITIAAAVVISFIVALTVIPTAARQWLSQKEAYDPHHHWWEGITTKIMQLTGSRGRRMAWIVVLISVPLMISWWLMPKADYLPEGNRNLAFAFILPPPGTNIDTLEREMGQVIAERLQPYLEGEQQPHIKNYFFVAFSAGMFMGMRAEDDGRADELVPLINSVVGGFPDTYAFARRASLFGGFGEGNTVEMNLQGASIDEILKAGQNGYGLVSKAVPGASVRPYPELILAEPELRLIPDDHRIAEVGWSREIMAQVTRAFGQGLFVGDYFDGDERLNIILRVMPWNTPEELAAMPLATPERGIQPLSELMQVKRTAGPDQIRRLDRRRTITLQVTPPAGISLEETLDSLQQQVEPVLLEMMPEDGVIRYSGTADKLLAALTNMARSFVLAVVILYLLMSALFRSFLDSILVLLILPLATFGGIVALRLGALSMDLITMIGFIILLGLVVNNAILLVHQTRSAEREGLSRRKAVEQAVHLRLRPILMTTLTSIFGMLPLLLMPGAGTELYRGMAAVIVGGMAVSTLFTLILLPSMLRMGEEKKTNQVVG
jgi:multidrug efflux pump subunit AcrB